MTCIDADYLAYVRLIALDSCGRQVTGANKQMVLTNQMRRVAFDDAIERGTDRVRRGVTGAACRSVPGCVTESPKPFTLDFCGFNFDFAVMAGLASRATPLTGVGWGRVAADCNAALAAELVFKPPVDQSCTGGSAQCLRLFFPKVAAWGPANGLELTGDEDIDNFQSFSGMALKNPGIFADFGHVSTDLAIWAQYWEDLPEAIFWVHYGDCPVTPTASCDLTTLAASPS